jgi:hypothetical protein
VLTLAQEGKMRIVRLIVLSAVALTVSGVADAGWFGSGQPKPISVLFRGQPWDASHRFHTMREYKYNRPGWGGLWKQVYASHPNRPQPYIRGY